MENFDKGDATDRRIQSRKHKIEKGDKQLEEAQFNAEPAVKKSKAEKTEEDTFENLNENDATSKDNAKGTTNNFKKRSHITEEKRTTKRKLSIETSKKRTDNDIKKGEKETERERGSINADVNLKTNSDRTKKRTQDDYILVNQKKSRKDETDPSIKDRKLESGNVEKLNEPNGEDEEEVSHKDDAYEGKLTDSNSYQNAEDESYTIEEGDGSEEIKEDGENEEDEDEGEENEEDEDEEEENEEDEDEEEENEEDEGEGEENEEDEGEGEENEEDEGKGEEHEEDEGEGEENEEDEIKGEKNKEDEAQKNKASIIEEKEYEELDVVEKICEESADVENTKMTKKNDKNGKGNRGKKEQNEKEKGEKELDAYIQKEEMSEQEQDGHGSECDEKKENDDKNAKKEEKKKNENFIAHKSTIIYTNGVEERQQNENENEDEQNTYEGGKCHNVYQKEEEKGEGQKKGQEKDEGQSEGQEEEKEEGQDNITNIETKELNESKQDVNGNAFFKKNDRLFGSMSEANSPTKSFGGNTIGKLNIFGNISIDIEKLTKNLNVKATAHEEKKEVKMTLCEEDAFEDEDIVFCENPVKISKFLKSEDKSDWSDYLPVKIQLMKHKKNGKYRILCFQKGTGRLFLNTDIFTGFSILPAKTMSALFIGRDICDQMKLIQYIVTFRSISSRNEFVSLIKEITNKNQQYIKEAQ